MDLNNAAVFASVVEAKGFSAAGRLLNMPKTTVSKRVSDLEAELGVRLLNRTTRSVALTEAGARVYAHCVVAISHMESAEREARALQNEPDGMITIAAPGAIGIPSVLPAVTAFIEQYPTIQITLLSTNDLVDLTSDSIDVLVWAGASMPQGHARRLVAKVEIALFASAEYASAYPLPDEPRDLSRHRVVAFTQALQGNRFAWRLERGGETVDVTPDMQPRFCSNDATAILAFVVAGHGVGALPVRFVAQSREGDQLLAVLPKWRIAPIEIVALFRDGSSTSLKTRLFLDFLTEWFARIG